LKKLLGGYYINRRTHTLKSTIVEGRNSHGANELELNGRRVCGSDEWSSADTIDTTWINERVSGQAHTYEVRGCGAKKMSKVTWLCKLLWAFNEGQMPKFNGNRESLMRIRALPARAKYLAQMVYNNLVASGMLEDYTYPIDPTLSEKFKTSAWLSALLMILMRRFNERHDLLNPPASSVAWALTLQCDDNALAAFMANNVEITNVPGDEVHQTDLLLRLNEQRSEHPGAPREEKRCKSLIASFLSLHGLTMKNSKCYVDGERTMRVFTLGAKMKHPALPNRGPGPAAPSFAT
jgi:hypothetical protein